MKHEELMEHRDRRTLIRHPRRLPVMVDALQPGTNPWQGCTHNLSVEGLNLAVARRFEPGTPVSITFEQSTAVPLTAMARVMWVEAGGGGWLHGCQFAKPVDDEEFRLLLEEAERVPPPEPPVVEEVPELPSYTSESTRMNLKAIRDKLRRLGP